MKLAQQICRTIIRICQTHSFFSQTHSTTMPIMRFPTTDMATTVVEKFVCVLYTERFLIGLDSVG